jgi:hypothetical protein
MTDLLPSNVIATDRRLDENATRASEDLARHRWHWTLDESNPDRVSIRAYARNVGRSDLTIGAQVKGYAASAARGTPLNEEIERARMGGETEATNGVGVS